MQPSKEKVFIDRSTVLVIVSVYDAKNIDNLQRFTETDTFKKIISFVPKGLYLSDQQVPVYDQLPTPFRVLNFSGGVEPIADKDLWPLLHNINSNLSSDSIFKVTAAPNWYSASAQEGHPIGWGGPGKVRINADPPTNDEPKRFKWVNPAELTIQGKHTTQVFVMDTLPRGIVKSLSEGVTARKKEGQEHADDTHMHNSKHILKTLEDRATRVAGSAFDFYPANGHNITLPDETPGNNVVIPGHSNASTHQSLVDDHGLFIAGIIHEICPEAELHLIEVLNKYGVGSMLSLIQGLRIVYNHLTDNQKETKLAVINLSLMFCTPYQLILDAIANPKDEKSVEAIDYWYTTLISNDTTHNVSLEKKSDALSDWVQQDKQDMDSIMGLLAQVGQVTSAEEAKVVGQQSKMPVICIVAAAGNESAPAPDYPANAATIYGVGAVKRWNPDANSAERAAYTNDADHTPLERIWAFGGDWVTPASKASEATGLATDPSASGTAERASAAAGGILGASIASPSGYAWWAGTSFATAIASGALAYLFEHEIPKSLKDISDDAGISVVGTTGTVLPIIQA
jgi:hypothetical protein